MKHGYDATSVSQLTKAMGIGAPSLYAAFGDKESLFDEALAHYMNTYGAFMGQLFQEQSAPHAAVERMLLGAAAMFTSPGHPPGCLLVTAATNCSVESAPVQKRLRGIRASTVRALEARMEEAIANEQLPVGTDVRGLALFFSAIIQGMSAQARDGASRAELEAIARSALRAWPRARGA